MLVNYVCVCVYPFLRFLLLSVNGDCSCMDYVNADGFGNCLKQAGHLRGPHCYVNQPSTCKDIKTSTTEEGKQYSVEACEKNQGKMTYNCYLKI